MVLLLAGFLLAFVYGVMVVRYRLFPYAAVEQVEEAVQWMVDRAPGNRSWYFQPTTRTEKAYAPRGERPDGLNLVSGMGSDNRLLLKVVDMVGELVHEWPVDWFDIWADADHLPPDAVPKTRPGTHLPGTWLLPDGDILFNFEKQGTVRMGLCGEIRWRLPYQTHHAIHIDDDGYIWLPGLKTNLKPMPDYPAHMVPIREQTIIKVSQEGEILEDISVFDLLRDNGYRALLHMRASPLSNTISGDSLHLNDVEVFPNSMQEGFFKHGDVLISLRNINSVIVFDQVTHRIKLLKIGGFTRQHDPDFIDGNSIMLFDNNNIGPERFGQQSRILMLDASSNQLSVLYEGTKQDPFYTYILGKQQLLDNGHMLITDSMNGRAFEVNQDSEVVWEYINLVEEGVVGIVEGVTRLPASYRQLFAAAACGE